MRCACRFANLETIEEGYGLNSAPLVRLALDHYQGNTHDISSEKSNRRICGKRTGFAVADAKKAIGGDPDEIGRTIDYAAPRTTTG